MIYSRYYLWSWDPVNGYQAWLSHDWLSSFVCVGDNECYSVVLLFFLTLSPTMSLWILLFFFVPFGLTAGGTNSTLLTNTRTSTHVHSHCVSQHKHRRHTTENKCMFSQKSIQKGWIHKTELGKKRQRFVMIMTHKPIFFLHSTLI